MMHYRSLLTHLTRPSIGLIRVVNEMGWIESTVEKNRRGRLQRFLTPSIELTLALLGPRLSGLG
jgi:hypothetical protein